LRQFLIILLLFIELLGLQAEPHVTRNYAYRYFSTRDGLAQMQLMCAFQDMDGYLWFGTKGGVSRWDGIAFKNYTAEEGVPTGEIVAIDEWNLRKLFFTRRDITILFPNDSIYTQALPKGILWNNRDCKVIPIDNKKLLLFGLNFEFDVWNCPKSRNFIYDLDQHQFTIINGFDESVIKVEGNRIFTKTGIFELDKKKLVRKLLFPFSVDNAYINKELTTLILKPTNKPFFSIYKRKYDKFYFISKYNNSASNKNTWLPDGSFLFLYNNGHEFYPKRPTTLKNQFTYPNFSFIDRENNLWIGTENGLYNYFNLNIEEFKFNIGEPDNAWSIVEDAKGIMWFGCYGNGLWTLDNSNKLNRINILNPANEQCTIANQLLYMGSTNGTDNTLYMTSSYGVIQFKNGKYSGISKTPACLFAYYDKINNQIMYSGLDTASNKRGMFIGMDTNKKFYPFEKGYPITIIRDIKGSLRIGSFRGQGTFNGDSIIADTSKHEYTGVICMDNDNKGRLWKGTEKGIYVELANGNEYRVGRKQLEGAYTSLAVYKNKYLIVCGVNSFTVIDINNLDNYEQPVITTIGYDAGFTGLESGQNGICIASDGYVWLSTALSVLRFQPEQIMKDHITQIPNIRIDKISYSKDNINWDKILFDNTEIKLKSENKFFKIDYIANSISNPKSLRFRYRLVGLSDKWSKPISYKSVNYTNIGFGEYHFEVQCSLDGINWSKIVKSPEIKIVAPFYVQPLAIIIYIVLLILISVVTTRKIVKRNNQRKLELINRQKLENELQLNTLRSKIIPHFTKNVLSAIGHFAMTDKLKAGHYISVFSKFTGLTLVNADKNYNSIKNELEYIDKYLELEKMRFEERFDYHIDINKNADLNTLIPSMILHTYCDNAIRHGLVNKKNKGLLIVKIENYDCGVRIIITDNGIGRKKAEQLGTQGNGQGLNLIEAQLEFYNQKNTEKITQKIHDLYDCENLCIGTSIELYVPSNYFFH